MKVTTRYLVGPEELCDASSGELEAFGNLDDAVAWVDRADGVIYRCERVSESACWDWTFTAPGETPDSNTITYVSERAARNSAWPGCTIHKARRGRSTSVWQAANTI